LGRFVQPIEEPQERRLAGTTGTEDSHDATLLDVHRDTLYEVLAVDDPAQAVRPEQRECLSPLGWMV
jgi:hypothetical protein